MERATFTDFSAWFWKDGYDIFKQLKENSTVEYFDIVISHQSVISSELQESFSSSVIYLLFFFSILTFPVLVSSALHFFMFFYLFIYPLFNQEGPTEIQYLFCQGVPVKMGSKFYIWVQTGTDNIIMKSLPKHNNRSQTYRNQRLK